MEEEEEEWVSGLRPPHFLAGCNLEPPNNDLFQAKDKDLKARKAGVTVDFDSKVIPS
jgi:hypothetical protein